MDIKGAFDNICPSHIRRELHTKTTNTDLVEWYYNYITQRHISTDSGDRQANGTIAI